MKHQGGCHCGAVRYEVQGAPEHSGICHCTDCRKASGAPMLSWTAFKDENFAVTQGDPVTRNSSGATMRSFCGDCGTGLYYRNAEYLPGLVDITTATLDTPDDLPPQAHIQVAERIAWMATMHELPEFERFPAPE
ncbi:MAG TPA: GFA family protein [Novosphingobium sp.]|nr:GFA family protein [Novosphingobium sp.]